MQHVIQITVVPQTWTTVALVEKPEVKERS